MQKNQFITTMLFIITLFTPCCFADQPEIAITIDDLPFVGAGSKTAGDMQRGEERFTRILNAFVENQVPTTGFVIGGAIGKGQMEWLERFKNAGLQLGNHTYTHPNLNTYNGEKYIAEIERTDKKLDFLVSQPKYFRYPYLAEGRGDKKRMVHQYLAEHGFVVAPVTIDSKDYRFNAQLLSIHWRSRLDKLEPIKKRYLAYIANQTERAEKKGGVHAKQILLIHANLLNSYCLGDIIKYYKDRGYKFISLEDALKNPAPTIEAP
jgi:peptidoglycan/xylan/chitin deacetylase (PgdA/CDA1 family)